MASRKGISAVRLKKIYQRQAEATWDEAYTPSILATPQEAPSISRAFILTPSKLQGRETHLLSTAERNAALLGLYHPDVIGLQEQRMLFPEPAVHPLWSMQGVGRSGLPPLKGVIDVADRLGYLNLLPRLRIPNLEAQGEILTLVFPWIGDLLWAIRGESGRIYCVNWTIKDQRDDFTRPGPRRDERVRQSVNSQAVLASSLSDMQLKHQNFLASRKNSFSIS